MAAIEPDLGLLRGQRHKGTGRQALQAGGPVHALHPRLEGLIGERGVELAQGGDGGGGVLDLVPARKAGQRQIKQARLVLIDEAPALLAAREILRADQDGRAQLLGLALDDGAGLILLRGDDHGDARLDDARLLEGDARQG